LACFIEGPLLHLDVDVFLSLNGPGSHTGNNKSLAQQIDHNIFLLKFIPQSPNPGKNFSGGLKKLDNRELIL
jgi:hypothetical protein